jgi:maleylacetoacetate isomerase
VKLYSYFRSSAAYRLRIALNLKGLAYEYVAVNLLQREQKSAAYLSRNPLGLVPALELPDGTTLGQSMALLELLEELHPEPPLLPAAPLARARVRSVADTIACDIHPICNLAVTNHLKQHLGARDPDVLAWYRTWIHRGFDAVEPVLADSNQDYSFGPTPGMADICLVPQVFNARRFDISLDSYPHIVRVVDTCNELAAFAAAAPERQPDCPKGGT